VVKNSDGNGDISRCEGMVGEIADVIADEFAASAMRSPGALDVGFVAVEADVGRRGSPAALPARSRCRKPDRRFGAGSRHS
jgi:hypothetical protein